MILKPSSLVSALNLSKTSQLVKSITVLTGVGCSLLLTSCGINSNSTTKNLTPVTSVSLASNSSDPITDSDSRLNPATVISGTNAGNNANVDAFTSAYTPDHVVVGGSYTNPVTNHGTSATQSATSTNNANTNANSNANTNSSKNQDQTTSSNTANSSANSYKPKTSYTTTKTDSDTGDKVVTTTTIYDDGVKIIRTVTFHPISNEEYQDIIADQTDLDHNNTDSSDSTTGPQDKYTQLIQSCIAKYRTNSTTEQELKVLLAKCYPNSTVYKSDSVELTDSRKLFASTLGPQKYPYLITPGNANLFTDTFSFDVPKGFLPSSSNNPSYFNFQPNQLTLIKQLKQLIAEQNKAKTTAKSSSRKPNKSTSSSQSLITKENFAAKQQLALSLQQIDSLDLYVNTTSYDNLDYTYLSNPNNREQILRYFNHIYTKNNPGTAVTCSIFYNLPNDNATYIRCTASNTSSHYSFTYGVVATPKHNHNMFTFSLNTSYRNSPKASTISLIDGYADYLASHIQ